MNPLIIPVFLPNLGCRERCIFCNQKIMASEVLSPSRVRELIEASLPPFRLKRERQKQVAFYGGSFTAIPREEQVDYLKGVQPFLSSGAIDSIRISTRPDALDGEVLPLLKRYGVKTVEVGAQSMVDQVLSSSHRGHSAGETLSAVHRLKCEGFEVGIHLMIGLPEDSYESFLYTLDQVIGLGPDFIRIHPTLVLKGAPLEVLWREGRYCPMTLAEAIQWLKRGLLKLEAASIPVARIGLQPTKELEASFLAGPYHPALHQLVDSEIFLDMAVHLMEARGGGSEIVFYCHPSEVSNVRGQKNGNTQRLKEHFEAPSILIKEREEIPRGSLMIQTPTGEVSVQRRDFLRPFSKISRELSGRLRPPLPILFIVFFFLLFSCLPKYRVVYERRIPPPEKREMRQEAIPEERTPVAKIDMDRIERRETQGVQYGIASWYGPDFHGKPTSSGEIYDMYQLSCAHNTLALGTTVIVTNLENGKSLELKVNDRGPFVKERIIDLSYSAAKVLGIWEKGTAFVKVETVGPWIEEVQRITLQVGSFTDETRAQKLAEYLRQRFEHVHVTPVETSIQTYYRVRIGPFETRESAQNMAEQLSQMGYQVLVTSR